MDSVKDLRLMLLGRGGREHALAWKLSQSPRVGQIFVVPGNGGTARGLAKVSNIEGPDQYEDLVNLAREFKIDLVVVGPDNLVVYGIEGYFRRANISCFAPSKEAAEIEGSKTFAKHFMYRHNIPTADYRAFHDFKAAELYIRSITHPIVIKADGLAAGKGVIIPHNEQEAIRALENIIIHNQFGTAGTSVVIEEYLEGQEISVLTFSDGKTMLSLPTGQDHKRIGDGNKGLNTGGMGVYAPVPAATPTIIQRIEREILQPTFDGLRQQGRTFKGLLFTGIMLTSKGPKVLEYNARFGDPETQSIIPLLNTEFDLAEVMLACIETQLHKMTLKLPTSYACNVVIVAGGYPESYRQNDPVEFGLLPKNCLLFHSGTKLVHDQTLTNGGRVFTVVGLGRSLLEAVTTAYEGVHSIKFSGMFFRKDIAHSALSCM